MKVYLKCRIFESGNENCKTVVSIMSHAKKWLTQVPVQVARLVLFFVLLGTHSRVR